MKKELTSINISDLPLVEDISDEAASAISGGLYKRPFSRPSTERLSSPDGEPVAVYVDGVLVNSVTTGYYPG